MTTTIRIDNDLKRTCEEIFEELGLTMSSAINIFLKQVARRRAIPFELLADEPTDELRRSLDAVADGRTPLSKPHASGAELVDAALGDGTDA